MFSKRKREESDEREEKQPSALSKAISELSDSEESEAGEEEDDLSDFIEDDLESDYGGASSSDSDYLDDGELSQDDNRRTWYDSDEEDDYSSDSEEEEEDYDIDVARGSSLSHEGERKPDAAIVTGKRVRKPVERYQDPHFTERMLGDVPDEEIEAVLDEQDPYFHQRFRCDLSESEDEEEETDRESGYNTDDYEERDNAHLRSVRRPPPAAVNVLHDEDSQDAEGPITQYLVKRTPREPPLPCAAEVTLSDLVGSKRRSETSPERVETKPEPSLQSVICDIIRRKSSNPSH
jgi:hypothetical protein